MAKLGDLLKPGAGETSESRAASEAFVPGYDQQPLEGGSASERPVSIAGDFTVPGSSKDLSFDALKALSDYAQQNSQENPVASSLVDDEGAVYKNNIPEGYQDATGLSRTQVLPPVPEGWLPKDSDLLSLHLTRENSAQQLPPIAEPVNSTISGFEPEDGRLFESILLRDMTHWTGASTERSQMGGKIGQSSFGVKLSADSNIPAAEENAPILFSTMQTMQAINRFSPGKSTPFLSSDSEGAPFEQRLKKGLFTLQSGQLGKYQPHRTGVRVSDLRRAALETLLRAQSVKDTKAFEVAKAMFEEGSSLANADMLMLIPHVTQIGSSTISVDNLRIRTSKVMDTFATENSGIRARGADDLISIKGFGTDMGISPTDHPSVNHYSIMGTSYGTMNSPSEPFAGVAPFGMVMPAFYSIVVFGIFSLGLGAMISALAELGDGPTPKTPEEPWTYAYGGNYNGPTTSIGEKFLKLFGLSRDVPLELYGMARGVMMYYGINFNPIFPGSVGAEIINSLINLLLGPGFYLVVAKRVLQDFTQITKAFENFADINGVFTAISVTFSAIEAMMSSFTIRFFMIMNNLGRIVEDGIMRPGDAAHGGDIIKVTDQHNYNVLTPEMRNKISRFHKNDSAVLSPLSAHLFNSMWLIPYDQRSVGTIGAAMAGGFSGVHQHPGDTHRRIPQAEVEYIETKIDSEYMPFSIQDLRTNEVIGLPAFIQSISDDFSANYASSQGFGRTDPVFSYQKTTRQIALTFQLVAMNQTDHHYVWGVINKMVAMLYPQRDAGQLRKTADEKVSFIQPFSQRVSASPIVRIRVGDVIASNRSASAMKRIFGGSTLLRTKPEDVGEEVTEPFKNDGFAKNVIFAARGKLFHALGQQKWPTKEGELLDPAEIVSKAGDMMIKKAALVTIRDPNDPSKKGYSMRVLHDAKIKDLKVITEEVKSKDESNTTATEDSDTAKKDIYYEFKVDVADEVEAYALGGVPLLACFRKANELGIPSVPPIPPPGPQLTFVMKPISAQNGLTAISFSDLAEKLELDAMEVIKFLSQHDETYKEALATIRDSSSDDVAAEAIFDAIEDDLNAFKSQVTDELDPEGAVETFLSPENNAVVRAFDSSKGRGLAGVITQMGLDYNDGLWGTSQEAGISEGNLRAPKTVTVSLSFSPIHDMPLGLSHEGDLMAPSHPVGALATDEPSAAEKTTELEYKKHEAMSRVTSLPDTTDPGKPKLF